MIKETLTGGGPNPAVNGANPAAEHSGSGASGGVTTNGLSVANSGQSSGGSATGNLTTGGQPSGPPNGGLDQVSAGQPAETPDTGGSAPRGNRGPQQSNDDPTLSPQWSEQLSKKARADLGGRLAEFKTLDDFVQAYLDAAAPGEIRPERPGKPEDYKFAKSEPAFAKTAWEANLSVEQADALYAASLSQLDVARQSVKAAMAKDMAATEALLRDEYGGRYDEAVAFMNRGLGINPATGALSPIAQSLFDAGLSAKPEIVRAFIELGRAVSEGSAPGGSVGAPLPASVMQGRGFGYKSSYN